MFVFYVVNSYRKIFQRLFCIDKPVYITICSVHFYFAYLSFVYTLREGEYLPHFNRVVCIIYWTHVNFYGKRLHKIYINKIIEVYDIWKKKVYIISTSQKKKKKKKEKKKVHSAYS